MGQGSMCASKGAMHDMGAHGSWMPHLHKASMLLPRSTKLLQTHTVWEFSKTQREYRVSTLHLGPRRWGF